MAAGGVLLSGAGQACLDALRCAAFLGQQDPQDLKQAILHTVAPFSSCTTTTGGEGGAGGEAGMVSWLSSLVSVVQGVLGEAGARAGSSRRRRRKKRRRREQGAEEEEGGQADQEEDEEEEATASEEEEAEGETSGGGASLGEGAAGGQGASGQHHSYHQQQQGDSSSQRPQQPGRMEVDPAASVSAPVRPRADLVMTTSSSRPGRSGGAAGRRTAVAEAQASGDVLGCIFSFVVGVGEASTGRQSVRQLGQLGLVCGKWREVSLWEAWWGVAAEEMLPGVVWGRGGGGSGRGRVLEHGRLLWRERRVWFGEEGWTRGLSVMFEVFDRMDGLQMLSARGALYREVVEDGKAMWLGIDIDRRLEVVGRPFSAASRDPEQRRFHSMRHLFRRGHEEGFASSVCVRVSVEDERTGRRALLWEEDGKQVQRGIGNVPAAWQPWVGEGGLGVASRPGQAVVCPAYSGPQLQGMAQFCLSVVEGQAMGVSEVERLYQLAGGDAQRQAAHAKLVGLIVSDGDLADPNKPPVDAGAVARFVLSVLG